MASVTGSKLITSTKMAFPEGSQQRPPISVSRYLRSKHVLDRVLASILLIPATPILLILVLLVRLGSPGPGIYRQIRVGRRGKTFTMYKIRTMRRDAEARTGAIWATANDPRLTRVGRFIRSMHLDELPQLFNVIMGEMALVGPRPERPEFTQMLATNIDRYLDRLVVHPGVTGLAQINLPPDSDLDSVRHKLVLDLDYIQSADFGLDARILCWTALRLVGIKSSTMRILRLHRSVTLPANDAAPNGIAHAVKLEVSGVARQAEKYNVSHDGNGACNGASHVHNGNLAQPPLKRIKPR